MGWASNYIASKKSAYISKYYGALENPHGGPIGYMGVDVGEEYIVTIHVNSPPLHVESGVRTAQTVRREIIIRTVLQEKFEMSTEAQWAPMTAATLVTSLGKDPLALLGRSNVNRWVTRRIWHGTTPIDFTLNLRFEAEYDAAREVLMPCQELHRICLPYTGQKILGNWFLSPPGPAPIQWWAPKGEGEGRGEIITVSIGNFIQIHKAVVKDVKISFNPKFQVGGLPISANVSIHFQTFEIQTKESLDTEVYMRSGSPSVESVEPSNVPSFANTNSTCLRR